MVSSTEFKALFSRLLDGGLEFGRLHHDVVVKRLIEEAWADNPALKEIGWSRQEALQKIADSERRALANMAIDLANQLFDGIVVENLGEISEFLIRADAAGKLALVEHGLALNEAGELFLSPPSDRQKSDGKKNRPESPAASTAKGKIIPVDFRRKTIADAPSGAAHNRN